MKKTFLMAIAAAGMLAACNNQAPKMDEKSETATTQAETKIAYVEVDSIMTQYTFAKEMTEELQKKSQNIQNTINQKGLNLQNAAAKFQADIQNNKYTQQQAEAVQAGLQKQNADLQGLQQRLGTEFQAETEKFNKALADSLEHFLAVYNKDKKYAMIVNKAGLLYGDKAYDITKEVIAGLNKAYKGKSAAPAKKKEEKKAETETKK